MEKINGTPADGCPCTRTTPATDNPVMTSILEIDAELPSGETISARYLGPSLSSPWVRYSDSGINIPGRIVRTTEKVSFIDD